MNALRILLVLLLLGSTVVADEAEDLKNARALFNDYVKFGQTFDPACADQIADSALIKDTRHYPTGPKTRVFPAPQFKELIRKAMPVAKARGDTNSYSQLKFERLSPQRVRIRAVRFSDLKKYSSPLVMVVGPDEDGEWRILEHHTESRP